MADGDGVVVVPREQALISPLPHEIIEGDKAARRNLYKKLGLPEDKSTK